MSAVNPQNPFELVNALQQENARLGQLVAQQQQLLNQRSEPMLTAVIDALANVAMVAKQGHPGAQQILASWARSLKLAEEAATGIVVARGAPGPGNGTTAPS